MSTGVELIKTMFCQMVVPKDADALDRFFAPEFQLFSNGVTQNFASFRDEHRAIYNTPIEYAVEFDDDAWVDADERVAGRVWITTTRPGDAPTRIEVVLIAELRDAQIVRLWELTWPNWSQLPTFASYDASRPDDNTGDRP